MITIEKETAQNSILYNVSDLKVGDIVVVDRNLCYHGYGLNYISNLVEMRVDRIGRDTVKLSTNYTPHYSGNLPGNEKLEHDYQYFGWQFSNTSAEKDRPYYKYYKHDILAKYLLEVFRKGNSITVASQEEQIPVEQPKQEVEDCPNLECNAEIVNKPFRNPDFQIALNIPLDVELDYNKIYFLYSTNPHTFVNNVLVVTYKGIIHKHRKDETQLRVFSVIDCGYAGASGNGKSLIFSSDGNSKIFDVFENRGVYLYETPVSDTLDKFPVYSFPRHRTISCEKVKEDISTDLHMYKNIDNGQSYEVWEWCEESASYNGISRVDNSSNPEFKIPTPSTENYTTGEQYYESVLRGEQDGFSGKGFSGQAATTGGYNPQTGTVIGFTKFLQSLDFDGMHPIKFNLNLGYDVCFTNAVVNNTFELNKTYVVISYDEVFKTNYVGVVEYKGRAHEKRTKRHYDRNGFRILGLFRHNEITNEVTEEGSPDNLFKNKNTRMYDPTRTNWTDLEVGCVWTSGLEFFTVWDVIQWNNTGSWIYSKTSDLIFEENSALYIEINKPITKNMPDVSGHVLMVNPETKKGLLFRVGSYGSIFAASSKRFTLLLQKTGDLKIIGFDGYTFDGNNVDSTLVVDVLGEIGDINVIDFYKYESHTDITHIGTRDVTFYGIKTD